MPESLMIKLGTDVCCTDGDCGHIKSVVIGPGEDAVTHLVVKPVHQQELAKLVPLRLVDTTLAPAPSGEIRLRCSVAEYGQLESAEATYVSPGDEEDPTFRTEPAVTWPSYAPTGAMGMPGVMGMPGMPGDGRREAAQAVIVDTVPDKLPGADEVSPGEHVHASDGDIGHVKGIVAEPRTGRVTAVLVRERHLLSHRTVLVPRSAVAEVDADGFHLSMSKRQVQGLPPADIDRPAS
jgi:hypothetical protein